MLAVHVLDYNSNHCNGPCVDWLLERTVDTGMNGVSFGPHSFSDLGFADVVALLAELLELLVPALEMMTSEAASLGLEVNWQKTKVQALGSREDEPSTVAVQGQEIVVVEEFVSLGSLVHSTTQSSHYMSRRNAITREVMQNLDNHSTKLKLYNTCMAVSAGLS